jgi:hypothetical protein
MNQIEKKLRSNLVLPLWPDTGEILNLRRNATYAAAARGEIKTIDFGRLKRVPTSWLRAKLGLDSAAA